MMKEDMYNMSNSTFTTFNVSSSQTDMDDGRDLETNRRNGAGIRRAKSLQHVHPSLQKQQHHLPHKSPSLPSFNDQNARVHEYNDNYSVGRFDLSIYEMLSSKSKQKEDEAQKEKIYETQGVFTQTLESDHKLDKHLATYRPRGHVPENYKRLLESQSQKNNSSVIRSINSGKTQTQKTYDHISTDDRSGQFPSTYPSSRSESGSDDKERALGSCQLFRNEHVDSSKSSKTQYANSDSHNRRSNRNGKISLPKLQDVPCQLFNQLKDELHDFTERKDQRFLDASLREHLAKTFGISQISPLYLDHSEFVMWFLDENKCLFMWNAMENSVIYMGSNLEEGITNYLIHPDRMCQVIEDTFERVPVNEYERKLKEEFKSYIEEDLKKKILEAKANLVIPKGKKARKKSSNNK